MGCLLHESDSAIASKRAHGDEATLGVRWDARRVRAPSELRPGQRIGFGVQEVDSRPFGAQSVREFAGRRGVVFRHTLGVVLLLPETDRAEEDTKSQLCEQRALRVCVVVTNCAPRGVLFRDASSGHAIPGFWVGVSSGLAARPAVVLAGPWELCVDGVLLREGRPLRAWIRLGVWGVDERCGRRGFVAERRRLAPLSSLSVDDSRIDRSSV